MPVSGGTIVAPVNGNDPYDLLGVPKQPSGYDVGYICSNAHGRINMWAKYKPMRNLEKGVLSEEQKRQSIYGIKTKKVDTYNIGSNIQWDYQPPISGYPFRLTDFDKYFHNSKSPASFSFPEKIYIDSTSDNYIYFNIDDDLSLAAFNINIKDVHFYELDYYPGALLHNTTKKQSVYITSSFTLRNYVYGYILRLSLLSSWRVGDNVDMYPILAKIPSDGTADDSPAIGEMFYLTPEASCKGSASIVYKDIARDIVLVGIPSLKVVKTTAFGENVWHFTAFTASYKNEGNKTHAVTLDVKIDDIDGGSGVYTLGSIPLSVSAGQTISNKVISGSVHITSEYTQYVEVTVSSINNQTGIGGSIWTMVYDCVNEKWIE